MRNLPSRRTLHFGPEKAQAMHAQWKGDSGIGWEIVKATQHAEVLSKEYRRSSSGVAYMLVTQILQSATDPKSSPSDPDVAQAWDGLEGAIKAAEEACEHIMNAYGPSSHGSMKCFYHAEHLLHSLLNAERLLAGP